MMRKIAYILTAFFLLLSCKSTKSVESSSESHRMTELTERIDSAFRSYSLLQQQMLVNQSSLTDKLMEKERNDSSQTVVVNEKGDTVRERVVIYKYLERQHDTDRSELNMWMERYRETDSLLRKVIERQAVTDSLIGKHDKVTVEENKPTLWQRTRQYAGDVAIIGLVLVLTLYLLVVRLQRKAKS